MAITLTFTDLDSLDAQTLLWLAVAISDECVIEAEARNVFDAIDSLISIALARGYWQSAMDYDDIAGLQKRLHRTLTAIEQRITPEEG